jgi:pimeloyl-ACP methyl ester carboxylesterase
MKPQHNKDGSSDTNIEQKRELVVLVHGIWMTGLEMSLLAFRLRSAGFATERFFYHSLFATPAQNAERLYDFLLRQQAANLHLVAHSLGGIVLLHLFDRFNDLPPGRVVLLGSPVQGSGVAKRLNSAFMTRGLIGQSGEHGLLGGAPEWKAERDLGVIAGSSGFGVGNLVGGIDGPGDGTVSLSETCLPGASDYSQIPVSHMGMVVSMDVAKEAIRFLQMGRFSGCYAISAKNRQNLCSDKPPK